MKLFGRLSKDSRQKVRLKLYKTYKTCFWCGRVFNGLNEKKGLRASIEHLVPISLGGSNAERNLRLACEKCNL